MTADPPVRLSAETLAPCPFCGSTNIRPVAPKIFTHHTCQSCGANGPTQCDPAAWERRSPCPEGVTEEALARIIDPVAWDISDTAPPDRARFIGITTDASISKARAILAALSQRPAAVGGGKEDCSSLPPAPMPTGGA